MDIKYKSNRAYYIFISFVFCFSFFCNQSFAASKGIRSYTSTKTTKASIKETPQNTYQVVSYPLGEDVDLTLTQEDISYSFNFDADDRNFFEHPFHFRGILKEWLVLVNFHGNGEVNLFRNYDPIRDKGKRSLAWATPYPWAEQNVKTLGDIHNHLALLTQWTNKKVRKKVSFILIPRGTYVNFKIGYASHQKGEIEESFFCEDRSGFGLQIRLYHLPKETLILTMPLLKFQNQARSHKRKTQIGKEGITFRLNDVFKKALLFYQSAMDNNPIIIEQINEILHSNDEVIYSGINLDDFHAIMKDIYKLSCTED